MVLANYHVSFPGPGFRVIIDQTAFKVGNISVRWYGIIICMGFLLALWYVTKNARRFDLDRSVIYDIVMIGLIFGVIGARLFYVIFYSGATYFKDPIKILFINEGGLAIYGGIICSVASAYVTCRWEKVSFCKVIDLCAIGFLIGQCIGRWGNFTNQEAFGVETSSFFRMVSENTGGVGVHPCFLYESFWCFLGFLLLHTISKKCKTYDGELFTLYMIWYGFGRFFIESLRSDSLFVPGTEIKVSQAIAAFAVVAGAVMIIAKKIVKHSLHTYKRI